MRIAERLEQPNSRVSLGFLLAIVALAAGLRFAGIGSESLWLDEATSLILAQNPPAQIVALTAEDIHPPLYYLLLRAWLVFGTGEAAMRSLSAVIGVLTVLALYALGRELSGRLTGLLAALLLAVSPLHVFYSQETRMYALVTLWAVLSSWLMVRALRGGRWPAWAGYAGAVTLGMYTHYYMGFIVLAQNLCVGYLWLRGWLDRAMVRRWIAAQAAWVILFAPWVPTVIRQVRGGGGGWIEQAVGRPGLRALADTFIAFTIGTLRERFPLWLRRGSYVAYALALAGAAWAMLRPAVSGRRGSDAWTPAERVLLPALLSVVPLGLVWLIAQARPIFSLRYLLPFLPAFCLLLALGVRRIGQWRAPAGAAMAALLAALALWGTLLQAQVPQKEDWRGLTAYLVEQSAAGDVVMPEPFWNAKPLQYYAGGRLRIDDSAPLPATPAGVAAAVQAAVQGGRRLWLVENVGHYGDPQRLLAGYLNGRCETEATQPWPGIGMVTLFNCMAP